MGMILYFAKNIFGKPYKIMKISIMVAIRIVLFFGTVICRFFHDSCLKCTDNHNTFE